MSEQQTTSDDDDEAINPFTMILPDHGHAQHPPRAAPGEPLLRLHRLPSTGATLAIRQLPSQGLSFQLWPAATALVALLDAHRRDAGASPLVPALPPDRRQLSILELGSGTGLVGLAAAAALGARVTVTDLPHVVPNLQFNAAANGAVLGAGGGSVAVSALSWGEDADVERAVAASGGGFDVIVGSDVVYHDHLYEPLLKTLRLLLLPGGKTTSFVMAHLRRWKKESSFFKKARKAFHVDTLFEGKPLEGARLGVVVYRFSPKGNG